VRDASLPVRSGVELDEANANTPLLGTSLTRRPRRATLGNSRKIMIKCPKCKSDHIDKLNYGKRVGAAVGGVGGAAGGVAAAVGGAAAGAKAGAILGAMGGPIGVAVGVSIGTVAGAIAGGLAGGTVGATAGSVAGRAIDEHVLDNFKCLSCGYKFNEA